MAWLASAALLRCLDGVVVQLSVRTASAKAWTGWHSGFARRSKHKRLTLRASFGSSCCSENISWVAHKSQETFGALK
jgi:hypothetical protein